MRSSLAFLVLVWGVYGYMAYCDPMVICGIFFPVALSGLAFDGMRQ